MPPAAAGFAGMAAGFAGIAAPAGMAAGFAGIAAGACCWAGIDDGCNRPLGQGLGRLLINWDSHQTHLTLTLALIRLHQTHLTLALIRLTSNKYSTALSGLP